MDGVLILLFINFHKGGDRARNTEGNLVKNAAKTRMNLSS